MNEKQTAAILAVLDRTAEAWNTGDAAAFARPFTEDADYVTFFGLNMPGRQAIEDGHRSVFERELKGSTIAYGTQPPKVRFVRPDVAIVVVGGGSSLSGAESPDVGRESTLTYVLVLEDDEWLIASFQNTRRIEAFMPGGAQPSGKS